MDMLNVDDFEAASRAVLAFLHQRMGFGLWMMTRVEGDDWVVLQSKDHGYGVEPGMVFSWADTFCSEMIAGNGPRIAPRSDEVPAYAAAPIGQQIEIKAYVGLPIRHKDGSLFGTLCAIDPVAQPESIVKETALVELLGAMLSKILQDELAAAEAARALERLQVATLTDGMTELYNRTGWKRLLDAEEERCRRYGHPAVVLVIDLDNLKHVNDTQGHAAGDALITGAARALLQAARSGDVVARLGGDEFCILSVDCDRAGGDALLTRVRSALDSTGVKASVGLAMRVASQGLGAACHIADQRMYEEKRRRRAVGTR